MISGYCGHVLVTARTAAMTDVPFFLLRKKVFFFFEFTNVCPGEMKDDRRRDGYCRINCLLSHKIMFL